MQDWPVYNKYALVELPNGLEVDGNSPSEIEFLYHEIFEEEIYLQHGITVQKGDVVVDVGANIGACLLLMHMTPVSDRSLPLSSF